MKIRIYRKVKPAASVLRTSAARKTARTGVIKLKTLKTVKAAKPAKTRLTAKANPAARKTVSRSAATKKWSKNGVRITRTDRVMRTREQYVIKISIQKPV